jgi:hypothetical protein
MLFTLSTKALFPNRLTIFFMLLALAYIKAPSNASPFIMLPQASSAAKEEENLKCLLNVLRQFDYKRTPNDIPALDKLAKYLTPGLERTVDINTLLLQYYNLGDIDDKDIGFKFEPRKMISECKLNLEPAKKRCTNAYKNQLKCVQVKYGEDALNLAPFVTPECPEGFQRYGGTKCLRKCNYTEAIMADEKGGEDMLYERRWTKTNYCLKQPSYKAEIKRLNGDEKQSIGVGLNDFQMVEESDGEYIYVRNCLEDFKRIGSVTCAAKCPLGWSDMGHKCLKKGEMIFFPFVWTPGDGNLEGDGKSSSTRSDKKKME